VAGLFRYPNKSGPGESLNRAELIAGQGMAGNFCQGGERQLCLLTGEIRGWMVEQVDPGLCFARFKENIRIDGLPGGLLPTGARLRVGGAILQVSQNRKHCHGDCPLFASRKDCRLAQTAVFAAVEKGGMVKTEDEVHLIDLPGDI